MVRTRVAGKRAEGGFTLIEVMMVVVILGILVGIAFPSYQESVKKGHRSAAQAQMLDIANREQQFLLANRVYTSTFARRVRIVVVCPDLFNPEGGGRMRARSESLFDRAQGMGVAADDAAG